MEVILASFSVDGSIGCWELKTRTERLCFSEHTMQVTGIVIGYGGCNTIIVLALENRTLRFDLLSSAWSLSNGKLLRNIVFPSIIDVIALNLVEQFFYADSRYGKIFIIALNAESVSKSEYGMHIVDSFSNHRYKSKEAKQRKNDNSAIGRRGAALGRRGAAFPRATYQFCQCSSWHPDFTPWQPKPVPVRI
ncbi:hypothetical protein L6164_037420 [Bauhinia variegata]|uniref:Uncharacterized protein n=1 Tax=Bauhinia variegata TaxID=167791 RepID=A0ACB9KK26_BAUVA|nr:hypothetical protein L6164_037420 [Bauhinia variegata]